MKTIEKLQLITQGRNQFSIIEEVKAYLKGGGRWVQLRMKDVAIKDVTEVASMLKVMCMDHRAKLIIDDHPEVVMMVDANGVHLGKNDMSVTEARKMLGPNKLIGGTANTMQDIQRLVSEKADYIGLGPFRFTTTKKNLSPIIGLQGYKTIIEEMDKTGISVPVVAIGGIALGDIPEILNSGVYGIALSSTICNSDSPEKSTEAILALISYHERTKRTELLTQINNK